MARKLIPVDNLTLSGLAINPVTTMDAANGMQFVNTGREIMIAKNTDTVAHTLTIDFAPDRFGRDGSEEISVVAGETLASGLFLPELYNQVHKVLFDVDADTGMTVQIIKV
jgi:hypothetical protein